MRLFLWLVLMLIGSANAQTCTTTVSAPASNVVSAVSAAAVGDVVCLNDGTYNEVQLFNISKANYVTIKSVNSGGAVGWWRVGNSDFLRLVGVTGAVEITGCSTNIYIKDTIGRVISNDSISVIGIDCPTTAQNITIDGALLDRVGQGAYEGRISLSYANTVTIMNSRFLGVNTTLGVGPSDGIFMGGSIRNIMIGPGNFFSGIYQALCDSAGGAHCDMIQTYGGPCENVRIEGNWFENSNTFILNESFCSGTFKNNIVINIGSAQWHTWNPLDWSHNTVYNSSVNINESAGFQNDVTLNNNIWHNSGFSGTGTYPCSSCVLTYNVFTGGCQGTNCITGTPTYVGGTPPVSTWEGWALEPGSVGKGNASDGKDRGVLYRKPASPTIN